MILELDRLGVTYLLSREALREDLGRTGRTSQDYYFQRGNRRQNHFTPPGNEVVFRELYTWIVEGSRRNRNPRGGRSRDPSRPGRGL